MHLNSPQGHAFHPVEIQARRFDERMSCICDHSVRIRSRAKFVDTMPSLAHSPKPFRILLRPPKTLRNLPRSSRLARVWTCSGSTRAGLQMKKKCLTGRARAVNVLIVLYGRFSSEKPKEEARPTAYFVSGD